MATEQTKLRPRVAEAVKVWDSLPANDRKYKRVSEIMNITEGRAAVYVRDGLVQLGRGDETPRGQGNSGGGTRVSAEVPDFVQQMRDLITRNRDVADRLQTDINEATEAAEAFDGDEYIAAEAERLTNAVREAELALEGWVNNMDEVATKSAEAEAERLANRAKTLDTTASEQITNALAAAEQAEAFLISQGIELTEAEVDQADRQQSEEDDSEGEGEETPSPASSE